MSLTIVPEQEKVDGEPHAIVPATPLTRLDNYSLGELIENRKQIEAMVEEACGELSSLTEELFDNVNALIEGKVDKVANFVKYVIPGHIEACKKQIQNLEWLDSKIRAYTIDCIDNMASGKPLNGLSWRIRTQANPPSIKIDNIEQVPMMFKKATVTLSLRFDPNNLQVMGFWEEHIEALRASYPEIKADIVVDADNAALREVVLDKKDNQGNITQEAVAVSGVSVERGKHVRFEEGRAKPETAKVKKSKAPKEVQ